MLIQINSCSTIDVECANDRLTFGSYYLVRETGHTSMKHTVLVYFRNLQELVFMYKGKEFNFLRCYPTNTVYMFKVHMTDELLDVYNSGNYLSEVFDGYSGMSLSFNDSDTKKMADIYSQKLLLGDLVVTTVGTLFNKMLYGIVTGENTIYTQKGTELKGKAVFKLSNLNKNETAIQKSLKSNYSKLKKDILLHSNAKDFNKLDIGDTFVNDNYINIYLGKYYLERVNKTANVVLDGLYLLENLDVPVNVWLSYNIGSKLGGNLTKVLDDINKVYEGQVGKDMLKYYTQDFKFYVELESNCLFNYKEMSSNIISAEFSRPFASDLSEKKAGDYIGNYKFIKRLKLAETVNKKASKIKNDILKLDCK